MQGQAPHSQLLSLLGNRCPYIDCMCAIDATDLLFLQPRNLPNPPAGPSLSKFDPDRSRKGSLPRAQDVVWPGANPTANKAPIAAIACVACIFS